MNSFEKIQEANFSQYYINNILVQLDNLSKIIGEIPKEYKGLFSFKDKILQSEEIQNFNEKVSSYFNWINKIKDKIISKEEIKTKDKMNNDINNAFIKYSDIYKNEYLKNINTKFEKLKIIVEDIINPFDPPSINNNSDEVISLQSGSNSSNNNELLDYLENIYYNDSQKNYSGFYDDNTNNIKINTENNTDNYIECNQSYCKNNAIFYCKHCSKSFCEKCYEKCKKHEKETNHIFIKMDDKKKDNEQNKNKFLELFMNFLRKCIYKCNYILQNENQNYVDPNNFEVFQYPSTKIDNSIDSLINFLIDLNNNYELIKNKIDIDKSINEKKICDKLFNSLENIFGEKKLQLKTGLEVIEDDYYSDEKYVVGSNEHRSNENLVIDNNNNINKTKSKFHYIVNIINKDNYMFEDYNHNKEILEKITKALSINEEDISLLSNNNSIFINNFVKSPKFSQLSPKQIRGMYPNLNILFDFKLIIDGLIRYKCQIPKEKLDYKYNFINPNLSLNNKRGSEVYNPPYGWLGIGLNVIDKYDNHDNSWLKKDNNLWAIAYYGFGKSLSSNELGKTLKDIIITNELKKEVQNKCHDLDIRHNGKKVGTGFYLYQNINIAEKNSGIFNFNKKKYKIVLMSKVLIENIKEPVDHSVWIINKKENIRIYRILVKEIY